MKSNYAAESIEVPCAVCGGDSITSGGVPSISQEVCLSAGMVVVAHDDAIGNSSRVRRLTASSAKDTVELPYDISLWRTTPSEKDYGERSEHQQERQPRQNLRKSPLNPSYADNGNGQPREQ